MIASILRIVATLAFFTLAAALYTVATIGEAQAATYTFSGPTILEIGALWGLLVVVLSLLYVRCMNALDRIDQEDDK